MAEWTADDHAAFARICAALVEAFREATLVMLDIGRTAGEAADAVEALVEAGREVAG